MNFGEKSEIKSKEKIIEFLGSERIGRIATIDEKGFPFIAPMNFVYYNDAIYIHGLAKGEKYTNLEKNPKCGFEVDKELAFLPSYFSESPLDASKASTMYVSIVIKGHAELVTDNKEKTDALNALMEKSQTEGQYDKLIPSMEPVRRVGLLKIVPEILTGKYKFGKSWNDAKKLRVATKLVERSVAMPKQTVMLFNITGLEKLDDETMKNVAWTHSNELIKMLGYENTLKYPDISLSKIADIDW